MRKLLLNRTTGSVVLFFIIWQLVSYQYSPIILPSPIEVLSSFLALAQDWNFYSDILITTYRGLLGYVISMVMGIALTTVFYMNNVVKELAYPYIVVLQSIPRISWILLAMIWFPFNSIIVVFILIITLVPTIVLNLSQGFDSIDDDLLDMAKVYKVSNTNILRHIYIPSILAHIIASSKVSLGIMWKTVIMAELLTVQNGLGARMGYLRTSLSTEQIIALTCIIVLMNALCQKLLTLIYNKTQGWKKVNGLDTGN